MCVGTIYTPVFHMLKLVGGEYMAGGWSGIFEDSSNVGLNKIVYC